MDNKWLWAIGFLVLIVGIVLGLVISPSNKISEENELLKNDLVVLKDSLEKSNLISLQLQETLNQKDQEIISLTTQTSTSSEVEIFEGYLIDDLNLNSEFGKTLTDKDVSKLIDSEVDFMDDTYDVEEEFYFNVKTSTNLNDFEENPYLTLEEKGISYNVIFENSLNTSEISEDDTLVFNFLGQEVTISEWDVDTITLSLVDEKLINEGESYLIRDKTLLVESIFSDKVLLSVDGTSKILSEGNKVTINGIEVKVNDILYSSKDSVLSKVILTAGEDVIKEIVSGDEYVEDGVWEYVIDSNSIGLVLSEKFKELDDNDGFNAIGYSDKLCLPNDYVCVEFVGLNEEDTEEYFFDDDGENIVRMRGNFVTDSEDYTKIYFNGTNFADDNDFDVDSLISEDIFFGDSELSLTFGTVNLIVDNIEIAIDLSDIKVEGISIDSKEDNYRTDYGIIIENPEQSVEDNEFSLIIPENKLENSIRVY